MQLTPYSTARIVHHDEELSEDHESFRDFDSLLDFLTGTYDSFTDRYPLCGFGIDLTNGWGKRAMVGVGGDVWAFWGLEPTKFFTDSPPNAEGLVFFVDGWHYTECKRNWLVSREQCKRWLRDWLEHNQLPPP